MYLQFNIPNFILIFVPNIWGSYQVGLLSFGGEGTISKRCVQFNILDSNLIFLPNIWVSYQVWLLSLGPVGPWEGRTQFLKCVYNSTFLILSWFVCQTFGGIIKFDCCLWALSGPEEEGTLSKMFVQFNILDIICAKHLGEFLGSWIVDLSGAQLSGAQLSVF